MNAKLWGINVPLWPTRPAAVWARLVRTLPACWGRWSFPLLSPCEAKPAVLTSFLGSPVQDSYRLTQASAPQRHKDYKRTETSFIQVEASIQPAKEKAQENLTLCMCINTWWGEWDVGAKLFSVEKKNFIFDLNKANKSSIEEKDMQILKTSKESRRNICIFWKILPCVLSMY